MFLTPMSNFMLHRYYLLFDPYTNLLCIILNCKDLKFKNLIDNIDINF